MAGRGVPNGFAIPRGGYSDTPENSESAGVKAAEKAYASYKQTWDITHLESAIVLYQQAVDTAPGPYVLGELSHCLTLYYEKRGTLDDLQRAIVAEFRAFLIVPDSHPVKGLRMNNFSYLLRKRYNRLGAPDDLQTAILLQKRAVNQGPDFHPPMHVRLDNLGALLEIRFERFGQLEDIEEAIQVQQRAAELIPDAHPDKAVRLANLGSSLRRRYERLGLLDDLDRAIATLHRAVELTPDGHPSMPIRLDTLAIAQELRYKRFGELEDFERAFAGRQRAVELTPDGHPEKESLLNNLVSSLSSRFQRLGELDDLERAIELQRRVVELAPDGFPGLPSRLGNLGYLRYLRYKRSGELEDLENAIADQRRAVELTPDGGPDKAVQLFSLGTSLAADFIRERTAERFNEALSCYLMGVDYRTPILPEDRLAAARSAVNFLNKYPEFSTTENLLLAHSRVIDVLPEVVWLGYTLERRLKESQELGRLVSSAVCAAIGVGDAMRAVQWLDTGRALIWTQTLALRSPLHELERVHPDLARSLNNVHKQLQNYVNAPSRHNISAMIEGHLVGHDANAVNFTSSDRQRQLAIEYGQLLAQVRSLPGFESFMHPKKIDALFPSSATFNGPIVFINVDRIRCDALIVLPGGRSTVSVTLPKLTLEKAEGLRSRWLLYLKQQSARERSSFSRYQHQQPSSATSVTRILDRLWRWVVGPVLETLRMDVVDTTSERLPHITWCPTGPLTQLPLHAAGIYDDDGGPRTYNLIVSSYTPSLSALTRGIDGLGQQRTTSGILIITQPDAPGLPPLPGTTVEGARLREVFSASEAPSMALDGEHATTSAVKGVFAKYPWLHLACHGSQDVDDPLKSAFALHDGPISLSDLMATTSENAELAFLSACQTAVGDEKIPEEAMHLAAGMLAVGYKGVVATMWSIRDDDAPLVVEAYYRKLLDLHGSGVLGKTETGAAYALHEATKRLREEVGEENVVQWAPFVHFGV